MKTVKFLFAATILVTFYFSASAQEKKSNSNFGIKGGLNYTTVTKGKFSDGPDARTSFHIGLIGEIPILTNVFSLQPEVLYSRQGFETNTLFLGTNYKTEYRLDYINFPILAKLYLAKQLSIEAGPQFGLKISEQHKNNNSTIETNDVNEFDTALAAGLSFNFNNGLFLTGRYTQSINEVIKDSNAKNKVFQAGIGFKF